MESTIKAKKSSLQHSLIPAKAVISLRFSSETLSPTAFKSQTAAHKDISNTDYHMKIFEQIFQNPQEEKSREILGFLPLLVLFVDPLVWGLPFGITDQYLGVICFIFGWNMIALNKKSIC